MGTSHCQQQRHVIIIHTEKKMKQNDKTLQFKQVFFVSIVSYRNEGMR